jgi:hypothetical protein
MHTFDTDIRAEREEPILLLQQTTVIAESTGLGSEHGHDVSDAVEFGAGTKSQM